MQIIYPTPTRVNPRFGRGILRAVPAYRAPYTAGDAAWWSQQPTEEDRRWDQMAGESEAIGRHERGLCL